MKWFKHMTDAHDNNDITKLRMRYGADGYAVYWYCLELIAGDLGSEPVITFELKHDAEVIAYNLKLDTIKVEEMMRFMVSLGLFEQSGDIITCLKLAKYIDKKNTRNTTIHRIVDKAQELVADKSGLSPLDRDTDRDTDTNKKLPCQATPDTAGLQNKNGNNYKHEAIEILEFLNETTGRKYRPVDATLKPIVCRLRSGVTVQDCRTMIVRKWRDWHQDEKMEKYLRPATLFRASNFENYLAECVAK